MEIAAFLRHCVPLQKKKTKQKTCLLSCDSELVAAPGLLAEARTLFKPDPWIAAGVSANNPAAAAGVARPPERAELPCPPFGDALNDLCEY